MSFCEQLNTILESLGFRRGFVRDPFPKKEVYSFSYGDDRMLRISVFRRAGTELIRELRFATLIAGAVQDKEEVRDLSELSVIIASFLPSSPQDFVDAIQPVESQVA